MGGVGWGKQHPWGLQCPSPSSRGVPASLHVNCLQPELLCANRTVATMQPRPRGSHHSDFWMACSLQPQAPPVRGTPFLASQALTEPPTSGSLQSWERRVRPRLVLGRDLRLPLELLRGSQAPLQAVCGTHGCFWTMHGSVSAPSCCAITHRVAFEEGSGLLCHLTEKVMAAHSSTLAGKSHGRRSLVGCSPWGG